MNSQYDRLIYDDACEHCNSYPIVGSCWVYDIAGYLEGQSYVVCGKCIKSKQLSTHYKRLDSNGGIIKSNKKYVQLVPIIKQ